MSLIQFESAREKEKIREELRRAREELLKRAQQNAEARAEKRSQSFLSGESTWMLPDLEKKIDKLSKSEKHKKSKKKKLSKKSKSNKKKKSKRKHDDDSDSDRPSKKSKKKRKMSTESSSSSTSSSSSSSSSSDEEKDEWIEKKDTKPPAVRDNWMTDPILIKTFSKKDDKPAKEKQSTNVYDPSKSSRELNPHWKNDGGGLPAYKKPCEDIDGESFGGNQRTHGKALGGWRKPKEPSATIRKPRTPSVSSSSSEEEVANKNEEVTTPINSVSSFLTDQQMNELGAKIIKAEIMGNTEEADSLKTKLENARAVRNQTREMKKQHFLDKKAGKTKDSQVEDEHVLLTVTDNKGFSRPLLHGSDSKNDQYGGRRRGQKKNKKAETHVSSDRLGHFSDDDKCDIKKMFEKEKYTTSADFEEEFVEIAGKHKNPRDDLEDIFADNVQGIDKSKKEEREKQRAINEHERLMKKLDDCDKCFDSMKMDKSLMVSLGKNVYLSLPSHEGLQPNHCLIVPIQHVACSTQLDENAWEEILDYCKALTKMFAHHKQDVIFFETAKYLNKRPHMVIHCIPSSNFEMAPFYFKKAIQESEYEWSTNKQLISLKEKNLRRAIPKGLPYFWVNFGTDSGFAHVIEDQERFPSNFAQEIIGGMLHLNASKWRRPRKEYNIIPKVKNLAEWFKPYDFTEK